MRYIQKTIGIVALLFCTAAVSYAGQIKVFVAPFNVVGTVKNKDEAKVLLQAILTAKLADANILPVVSAFEADVTMQGTYIVMGNQFSLDIALIGDQEKTMGRQMTSGVVDATSHFDTLDGLAKRLKPDLLKVPHKVVRQVATIAPTINKELPTLKKHNNDIVYSEPAAHQANHAFIPRMTGEYTLIRSMANTQTLLLADARSIKLVRMSDKSIAAETNLRVGSQIINIDHMPTDKTHAYILVTYIHMGKVYTALYEYNGLALLPLNLSEQFFSRVANFNGSKQALVIQEQGDPDKPYFGAVYTASIRQGKIVKGDKIKLPHGVSLYGFNLFKGQGNERLIVAYDSDGYIVVYDGALNSIWKSTEKYGLSQLAFKIRDLDYINQTGKEYRTYFVNQRLIVTKKQTILAGYNDSALSIGDMRSYRKGSVFSFKWNGGSLEEIWHTAPLQNYMPDFEYDENDKSLYQIQQTQSEGLFQRQAAMSSVLMRKVE